MSKRIFAIVLFLLSTPAFAIFTNGGFEDGSFNGWTVSTGLNPGTGLTGTPPYTGASIPVFSIGGVNTSDIITASYTDPRAPHLTFPFSGTYTARVGDTTTNWNVNILEQTDTITIADKDPGDGQLHVRFSYAVVLDKPSHSDNEQPYFYVTLTDETLGTTLFETFSFATSAFPGFTHSSGTWLSTDMLNQDIVVPMASLGNTLKIKAIAAGCAQGGHGGYVYLDGFGSQIQGNTPTTAVPTLSAWTLAGMALLLLAAAGIARRKMFT